MQRPPGNRGFDTFVYTQYTVYTLVVRRVIMTIAQLIRRALGIPEKPKPISESALRESILNAVFEQDEQKIERKTR